VAKKRNKRKPSSKSRSRASSNTSNVNDYKKKLSINENPSCELITDILEDIKNSSGNAKICNHILADMIKDSNFLRGLKSVLTSKNLELVLLPLSYRGDATIDDNLIWMSTILNAFHVELREYIEQKEVVERALLLGNDDEFTNSINNIERSCGTSLWSTTSKLSKLFFDGKDDEVIKFRNSVPDDLNIIANSCLINTIVTSRSSISLDGYLTSLSRQSEDLRASGHIYFDEYIKCIDNFDPTYKLIEPKIVASCFGYSKLCDLYNSYKRLLKYCIVHEINVPNSIKACESLNGALGDIELDNIIFNFEYKPETKQPFLLNSIESKVYRVFDLYLEEKYSSVLDEAEIILNEHPNLSILYEVVARSQLYCDRNINCSNIVKSVIDCISNLCQKKDVEQNIKRLGRLFLNLKQFDWSYHLKAHLLKFDYKEAALVSQQYNFSDVTFLRLNPFDLASLQVVVNKIGIESLKKGIEQFEAVSTFILCANSDTYKNSEQKIPQWRYTKLKADKHFKSRSFSKAKSFYAELSNLDSGSYCQQELRAKIIESDFHLEEYNQSIKRLSKALLKDNEPSLFPLKTISEYIVNHIKANDDIGLLEACSIILYFYNTKCGDIDVTQEISNICENLIISLDMSDFEDINFKNWPLSPVILTHILNVEVLDGFVRHFEDDLDVYITRIKLCQNLLEQIKDIENVGLHRHLVHESQSSFNKMVLYVCASDTSEGKLKVDKESLRVSLIENLLDDYESLNELYDNGQPMEMVSISDKEAATVTGSGSEYQMKLADMLVHIVNEYSMNKLYGLDNSLNVGIRHGEVVDHLWASLKRYKIAGNRNDDNSFDTKDIFEDYKLFNAQKLKQYRDIYKEFLFELDKTIKLFRNNCNVDAGELVYEENRFFNYKIERTWVDSFIEAHRSNASIEGLIDFIFEILDEKTVRSFHIVKKEKIDELQRTIHKLYTDLLDELKICPRALIQKITLSMNMMMEQIVSLREWFDWADEPKHPFIIGAAAEKSKELITSLHPDIKFSNLTMVQNKELIESSYFTSFVSVFSLIYENSIKHCGTHEVTLEEKLEFNGSGLVMTFSNRVEQSKVSNLLGKIDEINKKLDGDVIGWASRDSGSGIFKVKSILDNKVKVENQMQVSLSKQNKFSVHINILNWDSLKYEDSDS